MQDHIHKLMTGLIHRPLCLETTLKLLDLGDQACQVFNSDNDNEDCENNDNKILHIGKSMMKKQ